MNRWLCPVCRETFAVSEKVAHQQTHRNAGKPSTAARGYGQEHRRLREQWAPVVERGGVVCGRGEDCLLRNRPEGPVIRAGEAWELGHVDEDRSRYSGPEHLECNRSTARWRKLRDARG